MVLTACNGGPADTAPDDTGSEGSADGDVLPDPEPSWSAEEVQAILQDVLDLGPPDLAVLRADYLALLAAGDADCPGEDATQLTGDVPVEGCTASTGYAYIGVSSYQWEQLEEEIDGYPALSTSWVMDGDFEIQTPEGERFGAGGAIFSYYADVQLDEENSFQFGFADILGTWIDETASGSLGQGISAAVLFNTASDETHQEVQFDGVLSVGGTSLELQNLRWHSETCADQAGGAVRIRDANGYWYDLDLDGDCSGCGRLSFEGDYNLWDICLEFRPFMDAALAGLAP